MANEFKHADPGVTLSKEELLAATAHYADGETLGDGLAFNGTNWVRNPAGTPLADDTYYLGSASKRWKGVYAPIYSLESSAVIIASDAPAGLRAYAAILRAQGLPVYVLDGVADQSEINTAVTALSGRAKITIVGPSINISSAINANRSNTTWHFINCAVTCVTDDINLMFGSGAAVTGVEVILENTYFDGDGLAEFGVDFEGNPSEITFRGVLDVRNCTGTNTYLRYLTRLDFDVIKITGMTTPTSRNRGCAILDSSNIHGNQITAVNAGGYSVDRYPAIHIIDCSNWQIGRMHSTGINQYTICWTRVHDFQCGQVYVYGNHDSPSGDADGFDLIGLAYNGTVGQVIATECDCSGFVLGSGGYETYNLSFGTIIGTYCGNRGVVLAHSASDAHNITVGRLILGNNGMAGETPHGLAMSDISDIQIGEIITYDDQETPTQTYPIQFASEDNRTLERIQFGLCNFENNPTKTPLYTVGAEATGQTYPFRNSGTATVPSGATSVVVNHLLGKAPTRVYLTPTNSMGDAAKFYVDTLTSTQFTIHVDTNPGVATAVFNWRAVIGDGV